jgi:hypothetical protein
MSADLWGRTSPMGALDRAGRWPVADNSGHGSHVCGASWSISLHGFVRRGCRGPARAGSLHVPPRVFVNRRTPSDSARAMSNRSNLRRSTCPCPYGMKTNGTSATRSLTRLDRLPWPGRCPSAASRSQTPRLWQQRTRGQYCRASYEKACGDRHPRLRIHHHSFVTVRSAFEIVAEDAADVAVRRDTVASEPCLE